MAKQTFTTGQVLTAAQMTSLQQTAMGGGSTTAKTASYVLVAADAGTVVQMNSASATTITVNTALFAAGDTVEIQNVGAGVCTVTAGTATVNTSSTLALKQYDAGSLYFNSASAAIFFATDAADSTSPLTTKGDLYGFSTLDARIPIGANNTILTADSAQSLGLKWAVPAAVTAVGASVYLNGGNIATTANTQALMTPNTATYDTNSFWSSGTNPSRLTIPSGYAGKYLINITVRNATGSDYARLYVYKNGSLITDGFESGMIINQPNMAANNTALNVSYLVSAAVADYFQVYFQNSVTNATNSFTIRYSISYQGA